MIDCSMNECYYVQILNVWKKIKIILKFYEKLIKILSIHKESFVKIKIHLCVE